MGSILTCHVAYQGEVDNLTKRSKTSENAFLSLYKKLAEAPDPYPLLDAAVVSWLHAALTLHDLNYMPLLIKGANCEGIACHRAREQSCQATRREREFEQESVRAIVYGNSKKEGRSEDGSTRREDGRDAVRACYTEGKRATCDV